jgi:hypothetical protein
MLSPFKLLTTLVVMIPAVPSFAGCEISDNVQEKVSIVNDSGQWKLRLVATTDNCDFSSGFDIKATSSIKHGARHVDSIFDLDFEDFESALDGDRIQRDVHG